MNGDDRVGGPCDPGMGDAVRGRVLAAVELAAEASGVLYRARAAVLGPSVEACGCGTALQCSGYCAVCQPR